MPLAPNLTEQDKRRLVREGYDAIAEHYLTLVRTEGEHETPSRKWTGEVLSRFTEPARVVELGCGVGTPVGRLLLDAGHDYIGVDVSARQLELAHQQVPGAAFVRGDATDLDLAPASCDAVLMLYVIAHIPQESWQSLFQRIASWLRPAGVLLLNAPLQAVPSWLEEDFLGSRHTNWTNAHDRHTTQTLIERAGLDIHEAQEAPDEHEPDDAWVWLLATKTT